MIRDSLSVKFSLTLVLFGLAACQTTVEPPPMRSLANSGRVSLLCLEYTSQRGRDLRACPDSVDPLIDHEDRRVMALVTQSLRGEVAVIDMHDSRVVDEEPALPGTEFLPLGANPSGIVSTPGGSATFVGTTEPGREALFALPSSCILPPAVGEPARDLSLWSTCRLPAAPAELELVAVADGGPDGYGVGCQGAKDKAWYAAATMPVAERRQDCPASLEDEAHLAPVGRRKLVVTFPTLGMVGVYDAQALLNQKPGTFPPCVPDAMVALRVTPPTALAPQALPADLVGSATCAVAAPRYEFGPAPTAYQSRPAGVALQGGKMFVADLGTPLVHVLDLSNPCAPSELEPLLPRSFDEPKRDVRTRDLSVSEPLRSGEQFVYAIDDADGSAMVFDVGAKSSQRTPLVRPGSPELPFEPPDRIRFDAPIRDLLLLSHDAPIVDPNTGTTTLGTLCDPNPNSDSVGSLYRTSSDRTRGAGPRKFRGTFGFMALGSGSVAAVDIEDFDEACRRPVSNTTPGTGRDWRGCAYAPGIASYMTDAVASVSDEVSCNIVQRHRARGSMAMLMDTGIGVTAPNLRSLPQLSDPLSGDVGASQVGPARLRPRLLAVPFAADGGVTSPSQVLVGSTAMAIEGDLNQSLLDVDPGTTESHSLLLPLGEPRVYASQESFTATYEGAVLLPRSTGRLPVVSGTDERVGRPLRDTELLLRDADALFCDAGVSDEALALATGESMGLASGRRRSDFASGHADYVQLTDKFSVDDAYFASTAAQAACGETDLRGACEEWFGTTELPLATRDLRVTEAYHDRLLLEPRVPGDEAAWVKRVHCCFPSVHNYVVRGGQQWVVRGSRLLHDIIPGAGVRCVRDCSPRKAHLKSRAFEVTSSAAECRKSTENLSKLPACWIGAQATGPSEDGVPQVDPCVTALVKGAIDPSRPSAGLPAACVFAGLQSRFAVYRGLAPSHRDMAFSWSIAGGWSPLSTSLVNASVGMTVLPEFMLHSPQLNAIVVVDSASGGVSLLSLEGLVPQGLPFL